MSAIQYDDRCPPILLTTFPDRPLEDSEWLEYLEGAAAARDRWGKVLLVTNASGTKHLPNVKQRSLIAEWSKRPGIVDFDQPVFVVMTSSLLRGVATAIGWMSGREHNIVYASDLEEALDKVVSYAHSAGIPLEADPKALLIQRATG